MTAGGLEKLLASARSVFTVSPELFRPIADFFNVDVEARLNDYQSVSPLIYGAY